MFYGKELHAMPLLVGALCVLALAYRYYSAFIAAKVLTIEDTRITPAYTMRDGHNYHPTHKWVLFGHHFAAIAGAGPLIGPVLAAQFGWAPGFTWLLAGAVLAGAVQDFIILVASIRRNGRSLAEIARQEIGPVGGIVTAIAVLFIIIIALAGLGAAVVNALAESAWGTFTIFCSIPIALFMGVYMYILRKGARTAVAEASVIGVILLLLGVWAGQFAQTQPWGRYFLLSKNSIIVAMAAYGFIASVLPVWLLLCPRDYLSSFMKLGTIALLAIGVIVVNPVIRIPAVTEFARLGNGPIFAGKMFPMVFITIMCGAISGFHALISSGTSPKMITKESHARVIGFGSMIVECLVSIVALFAVAGMEPNDYFLINTPPAKVAQYNFQPVHLHELEAAVGERLAGRTGGAPTLAVGMAQIFSGLPFMNSKGLMALWYHFAIMFEALFILTTIDTGTRIARFLAQEFFARLSFLGSWTRNFERTDWWPGVFLTSTLVVGAWAGFLASGSIATIWPMFGIANQMLAAIALAVGTTLLTNAGRGRYAWVTVFPMLFILTTTTWGGIVQIQITFWPMAHKAGATVADIIKGWMNISLIIIMIGCAALIVVECARKWVAAFQVPPPLRIPGVVDDSGAVPD